MASRLQDIQDQILALSREERQELLRRLLDALDVPLDEEIERAWLLEAQRRYLQGVEGKARYVPASVVLEKLRTRLEK